MIEVLDNNGQLFYVNPNSVVYIKQRQNYGLWKIVLINSEHILTDSEITINKIIKNSNIEYEKVI